MLSEACLQHPLALQAHALPGPVLFRLEGICLKRYKGHDSIPFSPPATCKLTRGIHETLGP